MNFFTELKRRNVVKVGIAYVVASWLLLQLTEVLVELLDLPDVAGRFVILILIIGFVPALIFAWAFEMTPEGIKREKDVDRSESITRQTGRKLDFTIIGMLAVVAAYFFWESRLQEKGSDPFIQGTEQAASSAPGEEENRGLTPLNDHSIAVLPFANRSMQQEDQFFTDGIHDDLLTQLAQIDDLKVISRTSVMEYRDTTKKIPEIAAELGVGKILEGGVQRAGQRIRINAQLIDVNTDEHLWAETFDREMTVENIFDIQSEITRQIVQAVRGELRPEDQVAVLASPTDNLQAYESFLRARAATNLSDYGRDKYIEAEPWALRAVELDENFAQAWALLAEIHAQAIWIGYDNSIERQQRTRRALQNALDLAPEDPSVMAAQADILYRLDNDYPAAYVLYQKARQKAPGDARIVLFTAITERRLGLWDESLRSFEKAHDMDPANVFIATQWADTMGRANVWERLEPLIDEWLIRYPGSRDMMGTKVAQLVNQYGDLQAARALFDRIPPTDSSVYFFNANNLPRFERDYAAWQAAWDLPEVNSFSFNAARSKELFIGQAKLFSGDEEAARVLFEQYIEFAENRKTSTLNDEAFRLGSLGLTHAFLGNKEKALDYSKRATELLPREKDHLFGSVQHRTRTQVLALVGQHEEAIDRLAADLDQPEGFSSWSLQLDPFWDFLRDNPRFNELVAARTIREGSS